METEIDVDNQAAVLDAARPFDKSYIDGRNVIMLAGSEIVGFARHVWAHGVSRHSPGRRARDHVLTNRIAELEKEVARLQAVVELADHLRNRAHDKRVEQIPFDGADKRRAPRKQEKDSYMESREAVFCRDNY